MSYSLSKYKIDDVRSFPDPPLFLTWIEEVVRGTHGPSPAGEGQVRHYPTLDKAKSQVKSYATRGGDQEFTRAWRVYVWENNSYTLLYQGDKFDFIDNSPLFLKRKQKRTKKVADPEDIQKAIESILSASK